MGGQCSTPRPGRFIPRKGICVHFIGDWVDPRTGAENLIPTWIRSPDRPTRSESLYRLRYPGPRYSKNISLIG